MEEVITKSKATKVCVNLLDKLCRSVLALQFKYTHTVLVIVHG